MARPKKDARLLKNIPLRIMLTADQRELIERAATTDGMDMTAWARPILKRQKCGLKWHPDSHARTASDAGPNMD